MVGHKKPMKIRVRYAARVRDGRAPDRVELASSVELAGDGASLRDLKTGIIGSETGAEHVSLSLGSTPLVPPDGQDDGEISLRSLGLVNNEIIWVTSLPTLGGRVGRPEEPVSIARAAAILPPSVQKPYNGDSSIVRAVLAAAMDSLGFDRVHGSDGIYTLSVENEPSHVLSISLKTSVMAASCMLIGEVGEIGEIGEMLRVGSSSTTAVARFVRFENIKTLDDRLSLYNRVKDVFCVPLLHECCRRLGVEYPLDCLMSLPREMLLEIVDHLPPMEAPNLGLVCKAFASIIFDKSGILYKRLGKRATGPSSAWVRRGAASFRSYPQPGTGGGMGRHIIGGDYDLFPAMLPSRGPSRSSQSWRI